MKTSTEHYRSTPPPPPSHQDASAVTHFVFGPFTLATGVGSPGTAHEQHAQHRHNSRNNRRPDHQHVGAYNVAHHTDVLLIVLRTTETEMNILDDTTRTPLADVWFSHGLQGSSLAPTRFGERINVRF